MFTTFVSSTAARTAVAVLSAVTLGAGGVLLARQATQPAKAKAPQTAAAQPTAGAVDVFKSATCGCCAKWNEHLSANGFVVKSTDMPDMTAVKMKHGVPVNLQSCHTAIVSGYVVEGHVPADVIKKLLRERPQVIGITVPGMPIGSPGMEVGDRKDPYDVLTFDKQGKTTVFAKINQ